MVTPVQGKLLSRTIFISAGIASCGVGIRLLFKVNLVAQYSQKLMLLATVLSLLLPFDSMAYVSKVQIIHASSSSNPSVNLVDVYVGGNLFADDLAFKTASPFIEILPVANTVIAVAPSNSLSASDAFYTRVYDFSTITDANALIVLLGDPVSSTVPFQILITQPALELSENPLSARVAFIHAATEVGGLDAVLRSGPMILSNLSYPNASGYLSLPGVETYIDVKSTGTTNLISTYRLSLNAELGKALVVLVTGNTANASALQLTAIYPDGVELPVDFAPVARVQYVNALPMMVDIFKNGTRFADDVAQGSGLAYKYIPGALTMNIGIADFSSTNGFNPLSNTPYIFDNLSTYTAVSAGPAESPLMYFAADAKEKADQGNLTEIRCFNANHLSGIWSVGLPDNTVLFDAVEFGQSSNYQVLAPNMQAFKLLNSGGFPVSETNAIDLSNYAGQTLLLLMTPPSANSTTNWPQLWVIDKDGAAVPLTYMTSSLQGTSPSSEIVTIAPNPAYDLLKVNRTDATEMNYQIISSDGRVQQKGSLKNDIDVLDVSTLLQGIYIIKFNHQSLKFIKC
jgi:Secretion system C-terminal sorting domain